MIAITSRYWPTDTSEMNIIQSAINDSRLPTSAEISPFIKKYQAMVSEFLTLAVPSTATDLHLQILNNMSLYIATLKMVSTTDSDPLSAMVGVREFTNYQQTMILTFINLQKFFASTIK
jgi:hypothetical protein